MGEVELRRGLQVEEVPRGGGRDVGTDGGDGLEDEGGLGVDAGDEAGGASDLVIGGVRRDHDLHEVEAGGVFVRGKGEKEALVVAPEGRLLGRGGELEVGADEVEKVEELRELVGKRSVGLQVGEKAEVAEEGEELAEERSVEEGFAPGEGDGVVEAGLGTDEAADEVGD